ncbi:MAG: ATP-binding protein [Campylobacteraceae bacterium]
MQKPYESLKYFYLGGDDKKTPILYENKDLTTHALIIGMTGSGKTGLGVGLIEEATIDNIPSIVIDPKGDMGNLLLAFPNLSAAEFKPWIDESEAANKGLSVDELAEKTASSWQKGLESWDMDKSRVAKYKDSADFTIYTPGATNGISVSVLNSFNAPSKEILEDSDFFNQLVSSTVTGILGFVGISADPMSSKEHILLSSIFVSQYRDGKDLSMEDLIHFIITPPFDKVGVFPLDKFFSSDKRMELAMKINSLIASPSFATWCEGVPLDVAKLLYTKEGKARVAVFSIAHLSDSERMFFVTLLLNNVIGWMRGLDGTSSLRAILYMDEIFGFFPPNGNPPSKMPMLTLLKQARAFGLGVVLSTQNPVDLDYKGLSNIGTWFVGRLQTAQDKERVIDGLSGISGSEFSKAELMSLISNLEKRNFLLKNIHENGLKVMQTRWALSYLKGPLSREQIKDLMSEKKIEKQSSTALHVKAQNTQTTSQKPLITSKIKQVYLYESMSQNPRLEPVLGVFSKVRFVSTRKGVDKVEGVCLVQNVSKGVNSNWEIETISSNKLLNEQRNGATYEEIVSSLGDDKEVARRLKDAEDFIYRNSKLESFSAPSLKLESTPDESIESFRMKIQTKINELFEVEKQKLKAKFDKESGVLDKKLRDTEHKLMKEEADVKSKALDTAVSFGSTILGALFGRSVKSSTSVTKAASGVKSANRMLKERQDVAKVKEDIAKINADMDALSQRFSNEANALGEKFKIDNFEVKTDSITPRKTDIFDSEIVLIWREI